MYYSLVNKGYVRAERMISALDELSLILKENKK